MPEVGEALGSAHTISRFVVHHEQTGGEPLAVHDIKADYTVKERKRTGNDLVFNLTPSSTIQRGSINGQQPVWPHIDGQPLKTLEGLVLRRVWATPRTVVLHFSVLILQVRMPFLFELSVHLLTFGCTALWRVRPHCLQVQLLLHTVSQVYTRSQWHKEIASVPGSVRFP